MSLSKNVNIDLAYKRALPSNFSHAFLFVMYDDLVAFANIQKLVKITACVPLTFVPMKNAESYSGLGGS